MTPLILHIETATTVCSVALSRDGRLLAEKELNGDYTHAENLTLFIEEVMKQAALPLSALDAIAVSKGPGSYTGLRIGVSTAKGLCYALDKPLIAINTLQAMVEGQRFFSAGSSLQTPESGLLTLFCPMLDARRMEVYCAVYDKEGKEIYPTSADIIDENSFSDILKNFRIVFFGDGAAKCREILSKRPNAVFADDVFPSAKNMIAIAEQQFREKRFENVAYFEPYYLKDFVGGKKAGE
jgi:tRNA threonylcarbamoyladenosine biosynthesis protein TsaB